MVRTTFFGYTKTGWYRLVLSDNEAVAYFSKHKLLQSMEA